MVFYIFQCKCKGVERTKYVTKYFFNLSLDFSKQPALHPVLFNPRERKKIMVILIQRTYPSIWCFREQMKRVCSDFIVLLLIVVITTIITTTISTASCLVVYVCKCDRPGRAFGSSSGTAPKLNASSWKLPLFFYRGLFLPKGFLYRHSTVLLQRQSPKQTQGGLKCIYTKNFLRLCGIQLSNKSFPSSYTSVLTACPSQVQ